MPFLRSVLAAVALVSQLLLGSLVLPDDAAAGAAARLRAVVVLCSSRPTVPAAPVRHRHLPVDPAACPLELALELPAVILMPTVTVPSPAVSARSTSFTLPAARAPPVAVAWARHARAPPRLV